MTSWQTQASGGPCGRAGDLKHFSVSRSEVAVPPSYIIFLSLDFSFHSHMLPHFTFPRRYILTSCTEAVRIEEGAEESLKTFSKWRKLVMGNREEKGGTHRQNCPWRNVSKHYKNTDHHQLSNSPYVMTCPYPALMLLTCCFLWVKYWSHTCGVKSILFIIELPILSSIYKSQVVVISRV